MYTIFEIVIPKKISISYSSIYSMAYKTLFSSICKSEMKSNSVRKNIYIVSSNMYIKTKKRQIENTILTPNISNGYNTE